VEQKKRWKTVQAAAEFDLAAVRVDPDRPALRQSAASRNGDARNI